jgi:serine protease Do
MKRERYGRGSTGDDSGQPVGRLPVALLLAVVVLSPAFYLLLATPDSSVHRPLNAQNEPTAFLDDERNTMEIARRVGPRVVSVQLQVEGQRVVPFQEPQRQAGGGSGFVVDEDGRIITNYHVVLPVLRNRSVELMEGASLTVSFLSDPDEEFPVRVHGANPDVDLALLEFVEPGDRPPVEPVEIGNSDLVEVGQKVVAIGNPFGLHSTVTTGIVSAIERERPGIAGIEIPYIQTDAAINPGNSGGPLLDSGGRVIGINNAILGPGAFIGIGFAVPSSLLMETWDGLVEGGLTGFVAAVAEIPNRPRLGMSTRFGVEDYPEEVVEELDLPEHGVIVESVTPGGPAAEAGLQGPRLGVVVGETIFPAGGDIITHIEGEPVHTIRDIQEVVLEREAGDVVELTVWRGGEVRTIRVELRVVEPEPVQPPR